MRYLLTNDDGIYANGLRALYEELSKDAECIIVAPEVEQSAIGHAITIFKPLMVRKIEDNGKYIGYAVSGTPADCVKIGIKELSEGPIDLVISGINRGANVGINVLYSGTVSAATEGAILGIPSMAISLDCRHEPDYSFAANFSRKMAGFFAYNCTYKNIALNINIPNLSEADYNGIAVTRQGTMPLDENFDKRRDPRDNLYYWLSGEGRANECEAESDISALNSGMISITPLFYDLTFHRILGDISNNIEKYFIDKQVFTKQ